MFLSILLNSFWVLLCFSHIMLGLVDYTSMGLWCSIVLFLIRSIISFLIRSIISFLIRSIILFLIRGYTLWITWGNVGESLTPNELYNAIQIKFRSLVIPKCGFGHYNLNLVRFQCGIETLGEKSTKLIKNLTTQVAELVRIKI